MSEHENGNFVLKCGQNQQKYQSFMAISDFALLYRIRRYGARYQSLSYINSSCGFSVTALSIRRFLLPMQAGEMVSFGRHKTMRLVFAAAGWKNGKLRLCFCRFLEL